MSVRQSNAPPRPAEPKTMANNEQEQDLLPASVSISALAEGSPPPINLLFEAAAAVLKAAQNAVHNKEQCMKLAGRVARLSTSIEGVAKVWKHGAEMSAGLKDLRNCLEQCSKFLDTFKQPPPDAGLLVRGKAWVHRHREHTDAFAALHAELTDVLQDVSFAQVHGVNADSLADAARGPTLVELQQISDVAMAALKAELGRMEERLRREGCDAAVAATFGRNPYTQGIAVARESLIAAAPLARLYKHEVQRLVVRVEAVVDAAMRRYSPRSSVTGAEEVGLGELKSAVDSATGVCESLATRTTLDAISITKTVPGILIDITGRLRTVVEELSLDVPIFAQDKDLEDAKDDRRDMKELLNQLVAQTDQLEERMAERLVELMACFLGIPGMGSLLGSPIRGSTANTGANNSTPVSMPWYIHPDDVELVFEQPTGKKSKYGPQPKELGRGAFGVVYEGVYSGAACAVKRLPSEGNQNVVVAVYREMSVVSRLRHPNVLSVFGATVPTAEMPEADCEVVMERVDGVSLQKLLSGLSTEPPLTQPEMLHIARQCAAGLQYLHGARPRVVHRDIKPANVMVTRDRKRALLIDFGLAVTMATLATRVATKAGFGGTQAYSAPEVLKKEKVTEASDVFSLGMTLAAMLTRDSVWKDDGGQTIVQRIEKGMAPRVVKAALISAGTPDSLIRIVCACVQTENKSRPTAAHLVTVLFGLERQVD